MLQGGYFKPPAEDATTKELYVHSVLSRHQRWASALETDRLMSAEFEANLKVRNHLSSETQIVSQKKKKT